MSLMFGQRKISCTRNLDIPCEEVVVMVCVNRPIALLVVAVIAIVAFSVGGAVIAKAEPSASKERAAMKMTVNANGNDIVFELNDSQAAIDLYSQLPLDIDVENYGSNEKIFYPPKKLKTASTPLVKSASMGTLAYYASWGNVVMFYGSFGSAAGLYELGRAVQGGEHIRNLSGALHMEK